MKQCFETFQKRIDELQQEVRDVKFYAKQMGDSYCQQYNDLEKITRDEDCMTFSEALELLKHGKCLTRKNWNGKNQYIFLLDGNLLTHNLQPDLISFPCISVLAIKTSLNVIQIGWLATQSDMLAEDWMVV